MFKQVPRKYATQYQMDSKKFSLNIPAAPHKYNDYLHPKYSLPPVKIDIEDVQWEFQQLLRTPGRAVRTSVGTTTTTKVSVQREQTACSCPSL
ncbi:unnamed protein product [Strongylus vulgaris]|uniref:Uncharacterized protein n=1 Tax=Strongylus vulgaris TaxID=40348 RepID=A0A3P7IWV7_STRVU|nr:unnamed protein product [Strongylus vulgaris]